MHLSFSVSLSFPQTSIQVNGIEVPSFTSLSGSIELNKNLGPHQIEREKERKRGSRGTIRDNREGTRAN